MAWIHGESKENPSKHQTFQHFMKNGRSSSFWGKKRGRKLFCSENIAIFVAAGVTE